VTEIEAVYLDKPLHVGVKFQHCPQCQTKYGYEIEEGAYLRVGDLKVESLRALCPCGYRLWWFSGDRHLRKIINRKNHHPPEKSV
jgi:hypothetical protein